MTELYEFVFVKLSGRPGHQGYFPTQGAPAPGQQATLRATLFGPVLSARAELVSTTGNLLVVVHLSRPSRSAIDTPDFYGNVVMPAVPFRVVVKGQELSGNLFTVGLKLETVFSPQTLQIEVVPLSSLLVPGTPARFYVQLVNYGAADTFNISATDTPSTSLTLSATSISLASQQAATIEISSVIPENSNSLPSYTLTVSASGVTNLATNSLNLIVDLASRAGHSLIVIMKPGSCEPEIEVAPLVCTPNSVR